MIKCSLSSYIKVITKGGIDTRGWNLEYNERVKYTVSNNINGGLYYHTCTR